MNRQTNTSVTHVESLESRCMLAGDPAGLAADGFAQIQWQGQTVWAKTDQWIAKVDSIKGSAKKQLDTVNTAIADAAEAGVKAVRQLGGDGLGLIKAAGKKIDDVKQALGHVKALKVNSLEPDFALWADGTVTPNDPLYGSYEWGLNNTGQTGGTSDADIDAPEAWGISTGSNSVVVGIVDT